MWLCYLRFDDQGRVVTFHIGCPTKGAAEETVQYAEQHGLAATARLVEYAIFHSSRTIFARQAPNFHFYSYWEFIERWKQATA